MQRHFRFAQAPFVGRVESASIVKIPIAVNFVRNAKSVRYGAMGNLPKTSRIICLSFMLYAPALKNLSAAHEQSPRSPPRNLGG